MGSGVLRDLFQESGRPVERVEVAGGERGQPGGERTHPLRTSSGEGEAAHPRCADLDGTPILRVGFSHRKPAPFQCVDEPGHRGRADALGRREFADGDRAREHDDRKRGEPGRGQPRLFIPNTHAPQQVDGGRMKPVGQGIRVLRWGSAA